MEKLIRFTQIAGADSILYALDERGCVWYRSIMSNGWVMMASPVDEFSKPKPVPTPTSGTPLFKV